ncbi:uncharacterized protein BYT42DRAFT_617114 [Radiomyces spectabilis]|uniref:uncharacterized protein n=1 Tax=Radiomyces spectabilis TaxID=64574 RepID=UPI00221FC073|nr:uncharacterized protein BYT42DRAFT_617114 [Radiomyces spectabilis]KAI8370571.1 hypothetical protein BYT42DRAFT_617114 [Radiomyces spectabilis]
MNEQDVAHHHSTGTMVSGPTLDKPCQVSQQDNPAMALLNDSWDFGLREFMAANEEEPASAAATIRHSDGRTKWQADQRHYMNITPSIHHNNNNNDDDDFAYHPTAKYANPLYPTFRRHSIAVGSTQYDRSLAFSCNTSFSNDYLPARDHRSFSMCSEMLPPIPSQHSATVPVLASDSMQPLNDDPMALFNASAVETLNSFSFLDAPSPQMMVSQSPCQFINAPIMTTGAVDRMEGCFATNESLSCNPNSYAAPRSFYGHDASLEPTHTIPTQTKEGMPSTAYDQFFSQMTSSLGSSASFSPSVDTMFTPATNPPAPVSPSLTSNQSSSMTEATPQNDAPSKLDESFQLNQSSTVLSNLAEFQILLQQYLVSSSPICTGELTLMIHTSKVAQKSYGTEKRFLCPPPTTVLLGSQWWTKPQRNDEVGKEGGGGVGDKPHPPEIRIRLSNDPLTEKDADQVLPGTMDWSTLSGALWNTSQPSLKGRLLTPSVRMHEPIVSGRNVSKCLHISDTDEKPKTVDMHVRLQLANGIHLGVFPSRPIRVISKPSKKRQSLKNVDLCIHHGSTVSLFNRIRSQTVSTRYLSVTNTNGLPVSYMTNQRLDWPNNDDSPNLPDACLAAHTQSWDPFIIWIVDPRRNDDADAVNDEGDTWPTPPRVALKPSADGKPMPIYYNQRVVLQCVNTGLVSPVMVIRKVERGNAATGGGGFTVNHACSGGGGEYGDEMLGDPVSQLHKIGFQIVHNPSGTSAHSTMHESVSEPGWPHATEAPMYLSCIKDVVGIYRASGHRQMMLPSSPSATLSSFPSSSHDRPHLDELIDHPSSARLARKRRVSWDPASNVSKTGFHDHKATAHRRRVSSMSDIPCDQGPWLSTACLSHPSRRRRSSASSHGSACHPPVWYETIADSAVWTIVGTDCAMYTFWPCYPPTSAITPMPIVDHLDRLGDRLIVQGSNFTDSMMVWLGIHMTTILHAAPDRIECDIPCIQDRVPVLIVRGDGVVYRTRIWYDGSSSQRAA